MSRIIIIGIGGASCSGKTLLAKHIRSVLPSSAVIIHQDDFAPPADQVPYSTKYPGIQDWDDPPTSILWDEFRETLKHVRNTGTLPPLHQSHDHLNKQVEVGVNHKVLGELKKRFEGLEGVIWYLVDGFVLYWDKAVTDMLDVKLFLRVPHDLLKRRREERQVYVLQNPSSAAAGDVWVDPPNYFEQVVYPAYVKAHSHMFQESVEKGPLKADWEDVKVLCPGDGEEGMTECLQASCEYILSQL